MMYGKRALIIATFVKVMFVVKCKTKSWWMSDTIVKLSVRVIAYEPLELGILNSV
jgi:hypothetical protein